MSYAPAAMGTNGSSTTIRAVMPHEVEDLQVAAPRPLSPEEQARREHERTFVDDRAEAARESLRQNLQFLDPQRYEGPYAGLGMLLVGIAVAPAAIGGGIAGMREGATIKGAAFGLGAAALTALLMNPAAILITGRRSPFSDLLRATSMGRGWSPFWLAVAAGGLVGFGAGHLATRTES